MDDTSNAEVTEVAEATTEETTTTEANILDTSGDSNATSGDAHNFMDTLDVSYRNDPNINKFTSPDALAKGYTELSKMLGKDKVVLPSGEGDEFNAQMDELMTKLGMPETAEGYGLKDIDLNEDGIEAIIPTEEFAKIARDLRMTPEQAKGVLDFYVGDLKNSHAQQAESTQENVSQARTELRKEFGAAYEEKMQAATKIFKESFPSLEGSALANDPKFVRDLVNLSKNFSETALGDTPKGGTRTPGEAGAEKVALMQTDAYLNQLHPEHKSAVEKYRALLVMESAS